MALLPQPLPRPAAGYPGMWQNMEECNSFTGFAEAAFGFGVPLAKGAATPAPDGADMGVVPLTTGNRFVGISLSNVYTSGTPASNGDERYGVADILGVATYGVLFVQVGTAVSKGNSAFFDPATGLWHGASATGRLPIPGAEFDGSGGANTAVALRINVVPGGANVTAAS